MHRHTRGARPQGKDHLRTRGRQPLASQEDSPQKETNLANTLIWDFQYPGISDVTATQSVVFYYGHPSKLI